MDEKYKEDSTKGSSILQPLNYKNDVSTQAWIDSRVLATLSDWLDKNQEYPRHLSEVVRRPLELLCELLVEQGDVEMVDDTVLARFMLQKKYNVNLNRGDRGRKNVLHNQILSDKRKRLNFKFSKPSMHDADISMGKAKTNIPKEELDKMVEMYNSLGTVEGQTKAETLQAAIDSGCIAEEDMHQLKKLAKQKERHDELVRSRSAKKIECQSDEEWTDERQKEDAERIEMEKQVDTSKMTFADE